MRLRIKNLILCFGLVLGTYLCLCAITGCSCPRKKISGDKPSAKNLLPEKKNVPTTPSVFHRASTFSRRSESGFTPQIKGQFPARPGETIASKEYNEILNLMDAGEYDQALALLKELFPKYPANTLEASVLQYNIAECYFFKKDLDRALSEYEDFLKKYPDSPLKENVEQAIEFIKNIVKYKKMYVSPVQEGKK